MRKLVIIPTYNECENIARMIERVFALPEEFDILVVDDGSPDGTAGIVKGLQTNHPVASRPHISRRATPDTFSSPFASLQGYAPSTGGELPSGIVTNRLHLLERRGKQGLGSAYIAGFRWALERDYDWIFEMDADFSHNPDDLVRLYRAATGQGEADGVPPDGADVVVGSRYVKGVNVVNWPMARLLMSWFASRYVRFVTGMPVKDATAGFVCYSRRVLERIDLDGVRMKGYGFQIEMKYTAWRLGFRVREVSIIFIDRTMGTSKMSGGIFGEALFGVLALRFRKIRGRE